MKKAICVLTALATVVVAGAPLAAADSNTSSSGSRKSYIMRINPSSGSKSSKGSKSSTSTRKKSSSSDDSSSRSRKSGNVRGKSDPVYVEAHTTKNGTFVPSHVRGAPDGDKSNNKKPYSGLNRPRKSNK